MPVYLVDRIYPGVSVNQLILEQRAVMDMCQRFIARGEPIRYLRTFYVPGESRCLSLFEAPDSQRVEEVIEVARIPFDRVKEVVELPLKCS